MSEITIRPMMPEDWTAVSKIYLEGIATEHATFQTNCPPYTAWDASHTCLLYTSPSPRDA